MCGEVAEPFLKVGPPSMLSDGRLFGGDLAKFECQSCSLVFGTDYGDAGFHEHYARGYLQSSLPETLTADLEERSVHVARVVFGLALDSGLTPETVFEVGAGSGHLLRQLKVCWPTAEVSGSDLARDAVSRGSKLGLQLSVGGLEVVPEDGVDLVVAIAVLEHVPDPQNFLTRCAEVTTPGGAVVIAIPGRHVGAHDFWVRDHLWHFHQSHIVTLAHRAGLHVLTKFTGKSIYDLDYYLLARRPEPPLTHFEPVNQRRHNYAERESGLSTLVADKGVYY